jgi:fructokinase
LSVQEKSTDSMNTAEQIGGAPANFFFHVSQFGLQSRVVSAVGADRLGQEIHQRFAQRGLQGLIDEVPYPTGTVQVSVDTEG